MRKFKSKRKNRKKNDIMNDLFCLCMGYAGIYLMTLYALLGGRFV